MSEDDDRQEENYAELKREVKEAGFILVVNMGRLRDVHGAGKLGNHVVASIKEKLKDLGVGHAPADLPTSQWEQVLLYRGSTPAGRLIKAVIEVNEGSADVIREFTDPEKTKDTETLKKIRDLVCD